uniref:Uncharacterized protein n=1 Tax=Magnetococcus massalia (strain MO-1) TaxID=451514 RepID=A0A1S7LIF3_MAGMO|nr:conserved protein of unknown function [Candidatus Magnetococcus massalia]
MTDHENFDACPAGSEADAFHQRILNGLRATLTELQPRHGEIEAIPVADRDADEAQFMQLWQEVELRLTSLADPELPYDQKYTLSRQVQNDLMDMELL